VCHGAALWWSWLDCKKHPRRYPGLCSAHLIIKYSGQAVRWYLLAAGERESIWKQPPSLLALQKTWWESWGEGRLLLWFQIWAEQACGWSWFRSRGGDAGVDLGVVSVVGCPPALCSPGFSVAKRNRWIFFRKCSGVCAEEELGLPGWGNITVLPTHLGQTGKGEAQTTDGAVFSRGKLRCSSGIKKKPQLVLKIDFLRTGDRAAHLQQTVLTPEESFLLGDEEEYREPRMRFWWIYGEEPAKKDLLRSRGWLCEAQRHF